MPKKEQFSHPPLVEVAFEVTSLPRLKVADKLADFQEQIAEDYPVLDLEHIMQVSGANVAERLQSVYKFQTLTKDRLLRITIDRFNVVEQNYSSFKKFSTELVGLWRLFEKVTGKTKPTRVGLRFVNRLELPCPGGQFDLTKYVRPYYDLGKFENDVVLHVKQDARVIRRDCFLTVRSGVAGFDPKKEIITYVLDYDCYKEGEQIKGTIQAQVKSLHAIIEAQFLDDLEDVYINHMRTGKWS